MWLTIIVGVQVFVAPILAFTATYILDMDWDTWTFSFQIELLPWIISAAVMYGIISLVLGLAVGGYMPTRVADAGGWLAFLRMTRRLRDADLVDRSRFVLTQSPYGKVTRIVYQEVRVNNRPLLEVHGGLQLLAAPLQIVLIMLPLLVLRFVPSEWLQERRLLELALLVYLIGLVIGLRVYPKIASKVVGVAAVILLWWRRHLEFCAAAHRCAKSCCVFTAVDSQPGSRPRRRSPSSRSLRFAHPCPS